MDFFTSIGRQHPVTDRNRRNDFSQYQDEFTINREKGLNGFNDDVSEIEIGSDLINQDSINEIKNQQRLLLCHEESIRKNNPYQFESLQTSFEDQRFGTINDDKNNKNLKGMKASIEPKLLMKQFKTPQFSKTDRYNSPKQKKQLFLQSLLIIKSKEVHSEMLIKLAELKKIKSQIKEYFYQEQTNLKRIIKTYRQKLQIEIVRQFKAFALNQQALISNNIGKHKASQQVFLRQKLSHSQQLIRQMQIQLQQTRQQNDLLQQKLFDLQQKIVGVDLQVQLKFDKKKKQLQTKITQDVLTKYQSQLNHSTVDSSYGQQSVNNNQALMNLINQNKFLEEKLKEYEDLLEETDNLRKAKHNIQQMQIQLKSKERQIQTKQKDVDKAIKQTQKKSIQLERYQQSLHQKLKQFQEKLNVKQQSLQKWELSLQQKTNTLNTSKVKISPKIQTQRHYKTQHSDEGNKIFYDPKKHQKYELFDNNQKEKFFFTTGETANFKDKENKTERILNPQKSFDSSIGHNNKGSPKYGNKTDLSKNSTSSIRRLQNNRITQPPTEMKKITVDYYRPSTSNTYKYEPQYTHKSPSSHINSHKTFHVDNYRKISPRQRDNNSTTPFKNTNTRLTVDYRNANYQPSNDKSTISKSSIDNSFISGQSKSNNKIAYQGYDMKKSKIRNEITNKNDLGNKLQFLKSELKSQINSIL